MADIIKFETKEDKKIRDIDEQMDQIEEEYNVNCARKRLRFSNSDKITEKEKDDFFEQFCADITALGELQDEKTNLLIKQGKIKKEDAFFHFS